MTVAALAAMPRDMPKYARPPTQSPAGARYLEEELSCQREPRYRRRLVNTRKRARAMLIATIRCRADAAAFAISARN